MRLLYAYRARIVSIDSGLCWLHGRTAFGDDDDGVSLSLSLSPPLPLPFSLPPSLSLSFSPPPPLSLSLCVCVRARARVRACVHASKTLPTLRKKYINKYLILINI